MDCAINKSKPFAIERMAISQHLRKLSKMVKPLLKYISKKSRTNAVSPTCCTYTVEEARQNKINEPFDLQFNFYAEDDNTKNENDLNEELEKRLQGEVSSRCTSTNMGVRTIENGLPSVHPVPEDTYFAVPVHFIESPTGGFVWVALADADIPPYPAVTEAQLPSQQVPCVFVS